MSAAEWADSFDQGYQEKFARPDHPRSVLARAGLGVVGQGTYEFSVYRTAGRGAATADHVEKAGSAAESGKRDIIETPTPWSWSPPPLDLGQDAGINSRIYVGDEREVRHIPMVDFACKAPDGEDPYAWALASFGRWVAPLDLGEVVLFDSGNAYHAYFSSLLTEAVWREYMGRLVLVNEQLRAGDCQAVIDTAWVGRCLIRGYSTLRWTANHKSKLPALLRPVDALGVGHAS